MIAVPIIFGVGLVIIVKDSFGKDGNKGNKITRRKTELREV